MQAAAIEATASTGGQLMPPVTGAVAFLMADFLQLPYRDIVIAILLGNEFLSRRRKTTGDLRTA